MTNLTEQWKKGELDFDKRYYVKTDKGIYIATGEYLNGAAYLNGFHIIEVLATVPSYEEYLALQSDSITKNEGEEINAELEARLKKTQELELELRKENAKLKEQLAIAVEENKLLKRNLAIAIQTMDMETLKQIKELEK